MFGFLSTIVICATVIFLAIKQPTIKIETSQKRDPIFIPTHDNETEEIKQDDPDVLENMLGEITELFTGGDRVDENTTR